MSASISLIGVWYIGKSGSSPIGSINHGWCIDSQTQRNGAAGVYVDRTVGRDLDHLTAHGDSPASTSKSTRSCAQCDLHEPHATGLRRRADFVTDERWWPASSYSNGTDPTSTFSVVQGILDKPLRDFRKTNASDMFWVCPATELTPNESVTDARANFVYGYVNVGNYWTTHYFGMSASSFYSLMVPEGMVPADRKKDPKLGRSPEDIIWLGELRGVTHTRWRGAASGNVFNHPQDNMNVVTMNGAVHNTKGAGFWDEKDLKFYE